MRMADPMRMNRFAGHLEPVLRVPAVAAAHPLSNPVGCRGHAPDRPTPMRGHCRSALSDTRAWGLHWWYGVDCLRRVVAALRNGRGGSRESTSGEASPLDRTDRACRDRNPIVDRTSLSFDRRFPRPRGWHCAACHRSGRGCCRSRAAECRCYPRRGAEPPGPKGPTEAATAGSSRAEISARSWNPAKPLIGSVRPWSNEMLSKRATVRSSPGRAPRTICSAVVTARTLASTAKPTCASCRCKASLNGIGTLLTAKGWERAAIVWSGQD